MEKLRGFLNFGKKYWQKGGSADLLTAGHQVGTPELLFEKIEDSTIETQLQKLLNTKKHNEDVYKRQGEINAVGPIPIFYRFGMFWNILSNIQNRCV